MALWKLVDFLFSLAHILLIYIEEKVVVHRSLAHRCRYDGGLLGWTMGGRLERAQASAYICGASVRMMLPTPIKSLFRSADMVQIGQRAPTQTCYQRRPCTFQAFSLLQLDQHHTERS